MEFNAMFVKLIGTDRVSPNPSTHATDGRIVFEPAKAFWLLSMVVGGIAGLVYYASWSAFAVFLMLSAVTLCAGHSVGMHRLLIHRSFRSPLWLEHILVYLGTLVGMAGPMGMIKAHDMRDWHQRQITCPPHPSHDAGFFLDAYWQLCCSFRLRNPPDFVMEPSIQNDRFYRFLEATWKAQQIPPAIALYALGGWGWVSWAICLRIAVSLIGHWAVGHIAHKRGEQAWIVSGLPVQGYNLPRLAFLTFGESWHGNHHAFPHSARLGVETGQLDTGYLVIRVLAHLGLATDIREPDSEPHREGLVKLTPGNSRGFQSHRLNLKIKNQ
ncbi:fatty acid desaturase [Chromatiales bacterium (ex Bugula neritina AB1)]|nr:fatty acid desaturase [Chromatiales bacterium (ex Bugula neritina AB1)]